ncbi:MAG TPA: hypothetical protein VH208_07740 [Myxococcaceae bacterium]|nr:hypothetical protein [Myxococcaceae bacterium]
MSSMRGFTLLGWVLAVALGGLLAVGSTLSARQGALRVHKRERTQMMDAIASQLKEYVQGSDFSEPVTGPWNPPLPAMAVDRAFERPGGWQKLSVVPPGFVYYSYWFYAQRTPTLSYFVLQAEGDLDGNGAANYRTQQWNLSGGQWALVVDAETGDAW